MLNASCSHKRSTAVKMVVFSVFLCCLLVFCSQYCHGFPIDVLVIGKAHNLIYEMSLDLFIIALMPIFGETRVMLRNSWRLCVLKIVLLGCAW